MSSMFEPCDVGADGRHPDLDVRLAACVGRYERALDESLKASDDLPDTLTGQIDLEAEWFADAVTEGTRDPASTEGWPWDYAYLASMASDLVRHIGQSGLYPPLEERLAPEDRASAEAVAATPDGHGPADWPILSRCKAAICTNSNAALEVARQRIGARLAWDAVDRFRDSPVRLLLLANLIAKASPSQEALHRLALPSRCFVWGLDIECIILCRDVAERALGGPVSEGIEAAVGRIRLLGERAAAGRLCGPDHALAAMCDALTVLETARA